MSSWYVGDLVVGGLIARQLFVLRGVLRSIRFLRHISTSRTASQDAVTPTFYIVIPVLREAASLREAIEHFDRIRAGHQSKLIVVTTAREAEEAVRHGGAADTVTVADELARERGFCHLHYPDPKGLKADQINFAVDYCAEAVVADGAADPSFVVIYDVDSRPPIDSLVHFEIAIANNPKVSVFHQSSRFELRARAKPAARAVVERLRFAIADSGALRANRFVLAYEIPRLLNRVNPTMSWWHRLLSSVYAHVTGHGLCVRLTLLKALPLPARSPLEDMHYSFILGSRDEAMLPIASLDCAEVPESPITQFHQMTRWVFGPARFRRYLGDPATRQGWRTYFRASSAAAITGEWLSCAVLPLVLPLVFVVGDSAERMMVAMLAAIYAAQLVITEHALRGVGGTSDAVMRIAMYPVTLLMFGIAGIAGVGRLLRGGTASGKTERGTG